MTASQTKADLLTGRLLSAALELFRQRGYADVELSMIAAAADCSLEDLYLRFPRKEAMILALFERTAEQVRTFASDAPEGSVSSRFQFLMRRLLEQLQLERPLYRHLLPTLLDPTSRIGVLGPATNRIRTEVQGVYAMLVLGATDAPPKDQLSRLVELLYFAHLGLIFLYLQDQQDQDKCLDNNLSLAGDLISIAQKTLIHSKPNWMAGKLAEMAGFPNLENVRKRVEHLVGSYIRPPHDSSHFSQAENILRGLFRFRRLQPGAEPCRQEPCQQCLAMHLPRVQWAISQQQPIPLVLPAFPAKSANLRKVTGPLPDLGEELALRFLQERCDEIAASYEPGAKLVICSDGRVFSDLVGVRDEDVTTYRLALIEKIEKHPFTALQVFDLDDVRPSEDYAAMREWLMETYGEPLEMLEERTRQHEHHRQLLNGIHRFLFDDLVDREPQLSRNQARERSKRTAYEVIRRSNAWSRLVGEYFGSALRLSIHPQPAHSEKIGILLGDADDLWITPWHGVALLQADRFILTRRAKAEELGARLVSRNGRPSHYELRTNPKARGNRG